MCGVCSAALSESFVPIELIVIAIVLLTGVALILIIMHQVDRDA